MIRKSPSEDFSYLLRWFLSVLVCYFICRHNFRRRDTPDSEIRITHDKEPLWRPHNEKPKRWRRAPKLFTAAPILTLNFRVHHPNQVTRTPPPNDNDTTMHPLHRLFVRPTPSNQSSNCLKPSTITGRLYKPLSPPACSRRLTGPSTLKTKHYQNHNLTYHYFTALENSMGGSCGNDSCTCDTCGCAAGSCTC